MEGTCVRRDKIVLKRYPEKGLQFFLNLGKSKSTCSTDLKSGEIKVPALVGASIFVFYLELILL